MEENLEGYLTVQEAAQKMGRSTEQVRRNLREGKLAGRRIGGQWFIREEAVLYRVRKEEGTEMFSKHLGHPKGLVTTAAHERLRAFERINRRREDIHQRWERLGIRVSAVDLVREVREEDI